MKWRSLQESDVGSDFRPLREQFAERKQLIEKYVPAEARAVHARVIAELKQSGIAKGALGVGAQAPQFEFQDHNARVVRSVDLLSKSRLVLCFFRGRWCPFCVGQRETMNQVLEHIERASATLLAISPQTVKQSSFMVDQHRFKFPLLSDHGNHLARQFGLVYRVPDDQQAVFRRSFINLPLANGDQTWELPMPATYLLERDGSVAYASVNAVRCRFSKLDQLRGTVVLPENAAG
jgi:peroxiredoxin